MSDEHEKEWEDLDEKVILAQILAELQIIRMALTDGEENHGGETEQMFECIKCEAVVKAGARDRHASQEHKAPPGSAGALFRPT